MSGFYVYALTGTPVQPWPAAAETLESLDLGGIFAVAERMVQAPAVSEEALRRQHDIIVNIAARADAVLPARFGSLLEPAELRRLVDLRREAIRAALDLVRGREQMTVRVMGQASRAVPDPLPSSGTAYLEQRRAAASGRALPGVEAIRRAAGDLAVADRVQEGPAAVTVYHLIAAGTSEGYRARLAAAAPNLAPLVVRVSGPWPPFAFVPELVP